MTGTSSLLLRRALALGLMILAVALLGALLLLSSDPRQTASQHADQRLRYMGNALNGLSQHLETARPGSLDLAALESLQNSIGDQILATNRDLTTLYAGGDLVAETRQWLLGWLSSVRALETADPEQMRLLGTSLDVEWTVLTGPIEQLIATESAANEASTALSQQLRSLLGDLRRRGNTELADSLYETERMLRSNLNLDLARLAREEAPLFSAAGDAGAVDKPVLNRLNELASILVAARSQQSATLAQISPDKLANPIETLRERLAQDALARLAIVNEARILLNMYTLLLLGVLAYFGFRLARSYQALNRSHDELEVRVQERTQDLEAALSDLKESQSQLVQAEKLSSLGQLVAGVMHEINTPLLYVQNNVSVSAEMADDLKEYLAATLPILEAEDPAAAQQAATAFFDQRARFDELPVADLGADMASLAADSIDGLGQISELVQSLKDFSRLDRAGEDLFDVREGLERTLTITRNLLKSGVEVVKDFSEVPLVRCAPSQINQIFINLITNAVQAMAGSGTLTLSTRDVGDWIEICVADTGCGIPQEHLEKIMDPFFTTKPVGEGTGLGLSIVNKIVHDHGGQILIDSMPDAGTRITIGLPAADAIAVLEDAAATGSNAPGNPADKDEEAA
ncbi:MAG: ATP-binding protein [Pseudomonadota bacterium]